MPYDIAPYTAMEREITDTPELKNYYRDRYPEGLDLSPNSDLSKRIVSECRRRADTGRDAIKGKFDTWRALDRLQTSYKLLSEVEREQQVNNEEAPVSVVVPASMAILDTLVTYDVATFGNLPYYKYRPMDSKDAAACAMLQAHIELQSVHFTHLADLHTQFRDSRMYGFGMAVPKWTVEHGQTPTAQPLYGMDGVQQGFGEPVWSDTIRYEGHELDIIDPYNAILDPNMPDYKVQKAGYVGWLIRHDYHDLLQMENDGAYGFVNVKYLSSINGLSVLMEEGRDAAETGTASTMTTPPNISAKDVMYMYIKIVPKDWGLSTSENPEIWLFGIAADSIPILVKRSDLKHGLFPVAICAPESNGHDILTTSKMECLAPSQRVVDFLYNSHILALRKGVGGTIVMDPSILNLKDMKRSGPKVVCVRSAHWGRGIENAFAVIPQDNSTAANLQSAQQVLDMMYRAAAATDVVQGVIRPGERRTAREFEGTHSSAVSRLQRSDRMISEQSMQRLAYLLAMQTQQYATQTITARIMGNLSQEFAKEFGGGSFVSVSPEQLMIPFDVLPYDDTIAGAENIEGWQPIVQTILGNEAAVQEILAGIDPVRVMKHYQKALGVRQVDAFDRNEQERQAYIAQQQALRATQAQVMPDEQLMSEVDRGNAVPLGEGV